MTKHEILDEQQKLVIESKRLGGNYVSGEAASKAMDIYAKQECVNFVKYLFEEGLIDVSIGGTPNLNGSTDFDSEVPKHYETFTSQAP